MRVGTRIGVDGGTARIGVAACDPHGMLATPVETVPRRGAAGADLARIGEIATERGAIEIVVGLPLALSGRETASTGDAVAFAERLRAAWGGDVRLVDERLSTVSAHSAMRGVGRSQRSSRAVIDQAAAVVILQHAIDTERGSDIPPGRLVDPPNRGTEEP